MSIFRDYKKGGRQLGKVTDKSYTQKKEKKRKMKRNNKWQSRAAVMSEQKNASHVGGKQEWENRNVRAEERQKFNDREASRKRVRGRKW